MASIQTPKQNKKNRVFIDSSVLIAAAISPTGSARELINQGFTQKIALYISPDVVEEAQRNLERKAPQGLDYFYKIYRSLSYTLVKPKKRQIFKAAKIVIGKDAPIVAGALQSKADYLVTYDRKHLLQYKKDIRESFKIKVITPDELI